MHVDIDRNNTDRKKREYLGTCQFRYSSFIHPVVFVVFGIQILIGAHEIVSRSVNRPLFRRLAPPWGNLIEDMHLEVRLPEGINRTYLIGGVEGGYSQQETNPECG